MKTSSCKQKGRKLQQQVRDKIQKQFNLSEDDVRSTSMGASGEDILLSSEARKHFPFAIECKCQENISIWSALEQAETNAKGHIPLLVFKRNRSETYCALKFDDLMTLLEGFDITKIKKLV